ncbi:uncharacterized protein [Takifugu rubripes]|uniref:uncharacterized protein n=1 Tax=Takifugu rubripes TaxID=31033 RepID=UPI00114605E5|nr:uncharacterized protein LOC115247954 [Takifugu rubripes]
MSKTPQVREFVLNNIHPLVQSFLERTTVEQWESFVLGRPDDATTILVAELVLEIIAALSTSVLTTLRSKTHTSEERVLTKLKKTLPRVLSKALGIQEEEDNDELKTLTDTIQKEVRENLNSSRAICKKGTSIRRITPTSRINVMIVQFVELFKKFSNKIRTFIGPRPHKISNERFPSSRDPLLDEDIKSPIAEGIRREMNYEFQDIFRPLMADLPEAKCKELHHEISEEIKIAAKEISTLSKKSPETIDVKPVGRKIESFFAKCFAKVSLMRIFAKLKIKHPMLQAEAKSESVETILEKLSARLIDKEDDKAQREDALVQVFTDLSGNKVLEFNQELSNEIYRHSVPEAAPPSVEREVQSEVHADIRSKAWVFMGLMNWYLKTQVNWVIDRVTVPYVDQSERNKLPTPVNSNEDIAHQEAQRAKNKSYLKFVIQKVVYTVCSDAKMLPATISDLISNLVEIIWEKVKDKQFYTDSEVFKNLEKNIKKLLYKVLGSPEKVIFLIKCGDPVVVEQIMLIINKRMLSPRKKKSVICKLFSSLCSAISRAFKAKNNFIVRHALTKPHPHDQDAIFMEFFGYQ